MKSKAVRFVAPENSLCVPPVHLYTVAFGMDKLNSLLKCPNV
jgi:hypothetical protein